MSDKTTKIAYETALKLMVGEAPEQLELLVCEDWVRDATYDADYKKVVFKRDETCWMFCAERDADTSVVSFFDYALNEWLDTGDPIETVTCVEVVQASDDASEDAN